MSEELIVGIIAAGATILAAFIGGYFLIRSNKKQAKGEKDIPSINSGGHTIIASEKATQNIYFSKFVEPNKSVDNGSQNQKLSEIAEAIKNRANSILIENEEVLTPIFQKKPSVSTVRSAMVNLFHKQVSRADFSDWTSYLENEREKDYSLEKKELIDELLELTSELSSTIYSANPITNSNNEFVRRLKKKYIMNDLLDGKMTLPVIRFFTENYLEYLRNLVVGIGRVAGKIKSFENL